MKMKTCLIYRVGGGGDKAGHTEVVCMSPGSRKLYTTMINLAGRTPIQSDVEGDTSKSSSKIRE